MLEILIVIGLYSIYKIAREIIGNRKHLTDREILDYKYYRRSLSTSKQQRVTNHIGVCDICKDRFTELYMNDQTKAK